MNEWKSITVLALISYQFYLQCVTIIESFLRLRRCILSTHRSDIIWINWLIHNNKCKLLGFSMQLTRGISTNEFKTGIWPISALKHVCKLHIYQTWGFVNGNTGPSGTIRGAVIVIVLRNGFFSYRRQIR